MIVFANVDEYRNGDSPDDGMEMRDRLDHARAER
jgi:hypothetical protein